MKRISVAKAIQRGHLVITLPIAIIMLGGLILGVLFVMLFVGVFLGFILAWLYWSVAITKWKLWAYENVEDLVALKQAAVKTYLVWPDGNIFNKTEIKSSADAEREQGALSRARATFIETKSPFVTLRGIIIAVVANLVFAVIAVIAIAVIKALS